MSEVTQADEQRARTFFASWPRVTVPGYLPAALAETLSAHREAGYAAGLDAGARAAEAEIMSMTDLGQWRHPIKNQIAKAIDALIKEPKHD